MSAGFDFDAFGDENGPPAKPCIIAAIYEDLAARDSLLQLCDSVVRNLGGELDFQIDWWRFKYLADPEIAMEAAQSAARADLILLASESSELPAEVQRWFEGWLPNRASLDGALVLVQPSSRGASHSHLLRSSLRRLAKRARLDFMRLTSPKSWSGITDVVAGLSPFKRGGNDFPGSSDLPVHWGINE